jgi:hypothetical protein
LLYTAAVRRLLLYVLALFMLVSSAGDRIWCADGCGRTDITVTTANARPTADCPFCSGIVATVIVAFTAEAAPLDAVPHRVYLPPVLLLTTAVDHPPRA